MSRIDKYLEDLQEAEGMKGLPKGWTQKSLRKFSKSLTGKEGTKEKFFERCVEKMKGKIDNPEGFCASVKDELHGSTYWRGKGKTPQQAGKDVKAHQNVKQEAAGNVAACVELKKRYKMASGPIKTACQKIADPGQKQTCLQKTAGAIEKLKIRMKERGC